MTYPEAAFVGRDHLVGELVAAAEDAVLGVGSLVLLQGEAGIGKTSVVRALARSRPGDLTVSWGRCIADGSAPAFWPWRDVVAADPSAAAPTGGEVAEGAVGAERFERLNDLRAQLVDGARRRPRLHVIEDLQWADVASVLLLIHVGAAITGAPLMVVGTLRTGEPLTRQLEEAVEEVRRAARVHTLAALVDGEIAELVRAAGVAPSPDLVTLVRDRTGGNPLFVSELLRDVRAGDPTQRLRDAVAEGVPTRVLELVGHRLARLPDLVAEVVVTASVVGSEGDATTLAAIRGAGVEAVLDLLEQAQAARMVDITAPGRWQFRHELVRDAVYRTVPTADLARLHATVLDALAMDGDTPPPVLAHHALAAQPLLDADRAVALAARAGEAAFAQHAYEEAVVWLQRALDAAPRSTSARWRAELLVLCGEAHRHIGDIEEARAAFVRAGELTDDPALLARAALGFADPGADLGIAYRADDPVTGPLLDRAIAAQPPGDSLTTVFLEARLAAELHFSDDPGRARVLATAALERAARLDDRRALVVAGAVAHDAFVVGQVGIDELLGGSQQLLDWARADGSASGLLTAHRARVLDLLAAGDLTGMDAEILAFRHVAEPLRAPGYRWWPALWSTMRALLEGRHDVAEERAVEAYGIGERLFPTLSLFNLSFLLFFLRREQGRLAEMEQATRDYVASRPDVPALRVGLVFLLAELGRFDEAGARLAAMRDEGFGVLRDRNWPASWFQLARAASLVGDRELAAKLLEDDNHPSGACVMVSLATVCLGATDLGRAWLLHTIGDHDAADERYAKASTLSSRIGARGWLAQAQVDHARLLLDRDRDGDRAEARRLADVAAEAAAGLGLAVVAAAAADVRERLDAAPGATAKAPGVAPTAVFRRAGAVWDLAFADRQVQIPHARGLMDLARLLAHPGEAVSVLELAEEPGAAAGGARGAPALDERARREIRERLHDLDDEEAEAEAVGDGERAALAREQRQLLAETVARDLGLGGRSRRIGDPVERARKTVSTRIRRSINAVGRAHPELGRHLERSVDTGSWCAYRPPEPVAWQT